MEKESPRLPPHFKCRMHSKSLNQSIYLSYCRDHDEVLVQHTGAILLYQADPPAPIPPEEFRCTHLVLALILGAIVIVGILGWNPSSTPNPTPVTPTLGNALRTTLYNLKHENMRKIANYCPYQRYPNSTLGKTISGLTQVAQQLNPQVVCLCHHHLNESFAFHGIYAPVCIIPLGKDLWQPMVNPYEIPPKDLIAIATNLPIISRTAMREHHSLVFRPTEKWRDNTIGIRAQWPSLEPAQIETNQTTETLWIVHGEMAHCMGLALEEIHHLLTNP